MAQGDPSSCQTWFRVPSSGPGVQYALHLFVFWMIQIISKLESLSWAKVDVLEQEKKQSRGAPGAELVSRVCLCFCLIL